MINGIGNYSKHASIWDWSGYDRISEFQFWRKMAEVYGKRVLSPMAAIGETAAYMAKNGFVVTASDITKEMVEEGNKRYKDILNLKFVQANICDFEDEEENYDFAFIGTTDIHHLQTEDDLKAALISIHQHLRQGGGLGLELWYPSKQSWSSPRRTFEPLKPMENKKVKVWKEGQTEYNAEKQRVKISQVVYIQEGDNTESFVHEFQLQLFSREWFLGILTECGYSLKSEYGDYTFETWTLESSKWIIELIRN